MNNLLILLCVSFMLFSCTTSKQTKELTSKNSVLQQQLQDTRNELLASEGEVERLTTQVENLRTQMELSSTNMGSDISMKDEMLDVLKGINAELTQIIDDFEKQSLRNTNTSFSSKNFEQIQQSLKIIDDKLKKDSINQSFFNDFLKTLNEEKLGDVSILMEYGSIYISLPTELMFQSASAWVSKDAKNVIRHLSILLNKYPQYQILVEGHTDNLSLSSNSIYADNWELSVERALAIARIMQKDFGISPNRITVSGKGEYAPKANNDTAEGRAANRRTELLLIPNI